MDLKNIAIQIGEYYLQRHNGSHELACDEIKLLGVVGLTLRKTLYGYTLEITLIRPGILIGRRGENIEKLKDFLSTVFSKRIAIKIIEDKIIQHIFPYDASDNYFDEDFT